MERQKQEPQESMLTNRMDIGTQGFDEFQAILLKKSRKRTDIQKRKIDLLTLKYQMEDYLNDSTCSLQSYFPKFLTSYVDILYNKRKNFASDLSIKPIVLSQVLNNYRDPQDTFMYRLILHSEGAYKNLCTFDRELWPRVYYQDKICKFLSSQKKSRKTEEKFVTNRKVQVEK